MTGVRDEAGKVLWAMHPRRLPEEDRRVMRASMTVESNGPARLFVEATYLLADERATTYCALRVYLLGIAPRDQPRAIRTWTLETRDHAEIEKSLRYAAWRASTLPPPKKSRRTV